MPYITEEKKTFFEDSISDLLQEMSIGEDDFLGELNYMICTMVDTHLKWMGRNTKYCDLAKIIGTIECAKQEIYRRIAVPYEDKKKEENGDVFTV